MSSAKKNAAIGLLLFSASLIPRLIVWIYPGLGYGKLAIYDVQLYTDFGEQMVKALLNLDLRKFASINVGVPPLGTFLVGVSVYLFGGFLGKYRAGMLVPIIASSLTSPVIYFSLRKSSAKTALIAALIFSLDPYLIEFSTVYLDAVGSFFTMIGMWFFLRSEELDFRKSALIGLLLALAILTKFYFAVFTAFFVLLLVLVEKSYRQAGTIIGFSSLSLLGIPWLWFPDSLKAAFTFNTSMNSILPPIIFGPLLIGVPEAYPWYFLTYFGLGQVHWKVLPSLSQAALFLSLVYGFTHGRIRIDSRVLVFLTAAVLSVAFIPRNYWTYSWAMGQIKSEEVLIKQFYPYYFYLANTASGIAALSQFSGRVKSFRGRRILLSVVLLFALTFPFILVFNLGYPYWDFIFTLIFNYSQKNPTIALLGLTALLITSLLFLGIMVLTLILSRKIR
ncbi:MAG: hypothetical protein J7K49_03370 [Thaumarchaeota archaeon]|nr:hypothetical protein [Nitrososphaerota archaeon]